MPSNKNRLYIALYPSGVVGNEERKYVKLSILSETGSDPILDTIGVS
jgi:hypothetical protein